MTDTSQLLQQVQVVRQQLLQCRQEILNTQKKTEIDRLREELRTMEDALIVRTPLPALGPLSGRRGGFPDLNGFRALSDGRGMQTPAQLRQYAGSVLPASMIGPAVNAALQNQAATTRAQIEQYVNQLMRLVRATVTVADKPNQIRDQIRLIVQAQPALSRELRPQVENLLFERFLYPSQN